MKSLYQSLYLLVITVNLHNNNELENLHVEILQLYVNMLYEERHNNKQENESRSIRLSEKVLTAIRTDSNIYGLLS